MSKSGEELFSKGKGGPVECLGRTFESDDSRREYFTQKLKEKLADPEFRKIPGFPKGNDEDILRMSDPPYYTACPNPFLQDFVRIHGKPFDPEETYEREPFAVDVSVGKTDQLYKAHGYHTKVPHLAIVPSILHYTEPGDIVLDGFCGSGMTGLAAQWCGSAPPTYKRALEEEWRKEGKPKPKWGARRTVLADLSPAATFIAAGYNIPFDVRAFEKAAKRILSEVEEELGWMYETLHTDGRTKGRIDFTVWSEVFSCPECTGDVVFLSQALDSETKSIRDEFPCPHCRASLTKKKLERLHQSRFDSISNRTVRTPKRVPVSICYSVAGTRHFKPVDETDLSILSRIEQMPLPTDMPVVEIPYMHMTHERARMDQMGITHLHHFFLPRAAHSLAALWRKASACPERRLKSALLFFVEQALWGMSVQNRYRPKGFSQTSQYMDGVYYVPSQTSECSPWYNLEGKSRRLPKAFSPTPSRVGNCVISVGTCSLLPIDGDCVDYVFTDPPFGENKYYADLTFLVESWHRVCTDATPEAIVDRAKKKTGADYQDLMRECFEEYFRVLKPGRWMTVVFSNSANAIWRSIQEAMGVAGFVVADVRTLDKKMGSYRQVTSSAVKQDLVISAYKPTAALSEKFSLGSSTPEGAWAFIKEHLRNVPVFVGQHGEGDLIVERTAQMLHDRMIAFHVQRGLAVPLSSPDFLEGLVQRFPERDGMYFLPEQVAEYDKKRTTVKAVRQLELFVNDEASAVMWLRTTLKNRPMSYQDLSPIFMKKLQSWSKHERTMELSTLLEQNFICYNGSGPVPGQIHSYLSTNFKELRNLDKEDPALVAKAKDRWYVPEPGRQADVEKLRHRALLKEFEEYKETKQRKLKLFRTEAVRAGFKAAYDAGDYRTIVAVAAKLPEKVLQEDEKLLMYYDVASTRLGED